MGLTDRLFEELRRREGPLQVKEVARDFLRCPGGSEPLLQGVVRRALEGDPRFRWVGPDRFALAEGFAPHAGHGPAGGAGGGPLIADTAFTVFDLETTGASAAENDILEVGAARLEGRRVTATFSRLVRPSAPIPLAIQRITGITDDMVQDAAPLERAIPEFLAFAGETVLVAHNARFDCSFVERALQRLDRPPLQNPQVCSLRLARKLLPSLKSRSLDALCRHFGVSPEARHRALPDAVATAHVLARLFEILFERRIYRLAELERLQSPRAAAAAG